MQQFHKFITWRLCVSQRVSGVVVAALLVVVSPAGQITTNNAATATLQR
jgi:hypothetical protein